MNINEVSCYEKRLLSWIISYAGLVTTFRHCVFCFKIFLEPHSYFSLCDGRVLITECSGLAVISRYPIKESQFTMYTWKGTIWDGEDLAGKYIRNSTRVTPLWQLWKMLSKFDCHFHFYRQRRGSCPYWTHAQYDCWHFCDPHNCGFGYQNGQQHLVPR